MIASGMVLVFLSSLLPLATALISPASLPAPRHDVVCVHRTFTTRPRRIYSQPDIGTTRPTTGEGGVIVVPEALPPSRPPTPPSFRPLPLPVVLGGGLFLFAKSRADLGRGGGGGGGVARFAEELLRQARAVLRADPSVTMELGQGLETGGIYSFLLGGGDGVDDVGGAEWDGGRRRRGSGACRQLVLQFQIEGGNAWAQGVAYGIQLMGDNLDADAAANLEDGPGSTAMIGDNVHLVSLEVANMDASMNGTPLELSIPWPPNT